MTITIRHATEVLTVAIDDGSDGDGLTVAQIINVNGKPGKWRVLKVHAPTGTTRTYDIQKMPGNRHQRRALIIQEQRKNRKGKGN